MKQLIKEINKNQRCNQLVELIEAELPGLISEIKRDQYYLGEKRKHPVSWKEAERDYFEHYARTWATGFKFAYCNYACFYKDSCEIKER